MTVAIAKDVLRQLAHDLPKADLRLVLRTFEADMQRLGAALATAGGAGDGEGWRRAAHGIAGAAGAVAAVEVEQLARAAMARATVEPAAAAREVATLTVALDAALAELQAFLADGTFLQ
jgi:HPt (histidine-containing phosphotransfer) domain-containing protein